MSFAIDDPKCGACAEPIVKEWSKLDGGFDLAHPTVQGHAAAASRVMRIEREPDERSPEQGHAGGACVRFPVGGASSRQN